MTRQPMSTADAAWLRMDSPTNLMVITSVLWFDQPLDWSRVRDVFAARLVDRYPRFRQRVAQGRLGVRTPRWEDDPLFDIDRHLHRIALPRPGGRSQLEELTADLMATPLDPSKPLWSAYLVDGYGEGCAIVTRMHHCIADGIALARVLLSLTDGAADEDMAVEVASANGHRLPGPIGAGASAARRVASALVHEGMTLAAHPGEVEHLARVAVDDTRALAKVLGTGNDERTVFKGELGVAQRVAWTPPISLASVKAVCHATGTTVNDVLLAAVTGALRDYLDRRGNPVDQIRAFVPFNLRPLDRPIPRDLGNRFGLVFLPLPVGEATPAARLDAVHRAMHEIKHSAEGALSYGVLSVVGMTPVDIERVVIGVFSAKASAVMTNVPGPRRRVYLAGQPVRGVLVWAPRSGSVSMSVTIFSYNGEVTIGLASDAGLVPDPDAILAGARRELTELRRVARAAAGSR